ncbi:hypothetical protein D9M68_894150 [compost metagenome]
MVSGLLGESPLNLADETPTPREAFIARRLGRLLQTAAELKRDGASAPLREAVSRWAETPYSELEALRLRQLG